MAKCQYKFNTVAGEKAIHPAAVCAVRLPGTGSRRERKGKGSARGAGGRKRARTRVLGLTGSQGAEPPGLPASLPSRLPAMNMAALSSVRWLTRVRRGAGRAGRAGVGGLSPGSP